MGLCREIVDEADVLTSHPKKQYLKESVYLPVFFLVFFFLFASCRNFGCCRGKSERGGSDQGKLEGVWD